MAPNFIIPIRPEADLAVQHRDRLMTVRQAAQVALDPEQLERWCTPEVAERGRKLAATGGVLDLRFDGHDVTAQVRGSSGTYRVSFDSISAGTDNHCGCKYFSRIFARRSGGTCKHVVAVALTLATLPDLDTPPGVPTLSQSLAQLDTTTVAAVTRACEDDPSQLPLRAAVAAVGTDPQAVQQLALALCHQAVTRRGDIVWALELLLAHADTALTPAATGELAYTIATCPELLAFADVGDDLAARWRTSVDATPEADRDDRWVAVLAHHGAVFADLLGDLGWELICDLLQLDARFYEALLATVRASVLPEPPPGTSPGAFRRHHEMLNRLLVTATEQA